MHAFRSPDNPNLTGLVIAVDDMDALNAMLTSEEGQAAASATPYDPEISVRPVSSLSVSYALTRTIVSD